MWPPWGNHPPAGGLPLRRGAATRLFHSFASPGKPSPSAGQAPQGAAEPGRVPASKPYSFAPLGLPRIGRPSGPRAGALGYPARRDRPSGPFLSAPNTLGNTLQTTKLPKPHFCVTHPNCNLRFDFPIWLEIDFKQYAPVAQMDRAVASGATGRRFESCQAYHSSVFAAPSMRSNGFLTAGNTGGPAFSTA